MLYLGVDLGGTKTSVSLWRETRPGAARGGERPMRIGGARWPTPAGGPEPSLAAIAAAARGLLERQGAEGEVLGGIGISAGGPLDPDRGVILSVPNLPGWADVPIAERLSSALCAPARLENDANASAAAEWLHGAGKGARSFAFLTCSTGIGAGLILDGRLHRGARSLAGEVGHQVIVDGGLPCGCGRRGCLEAYASGAGMARRLEALRAGEPSLPASAREVVERAKAGDAFSIQFLEETAEHLAHGLANLVFVLDLDRIVLGTIPTAAGELFLDPLERALSRRLWPELRAGLEVRPSLLWPDLGDHAALSVARDLPLLLP